MTKSDNRKSNQPAKENKELTDKGNKKDKENEDQKKNSRTSDEKKQTQQIKTANNEKPGDENAKSAKKDYFEEELKRLRKKMLQMADEMKDKKPAEREFHPDTFNALEPYCDLRDAEHLFAHPDEAPQGFTSRYTALDVPDPWISHRMDVEIPQKAEDKEEKQDAKKKSRDPDAGDQRTKESNDGTKESTYPTVVIVTKSLAKKDKWLFTDVPKIRKELREANKRRLKDGCYQRTKTDFYQKELDKMEKCSPRNRSTMTDVYSAYLQDKPGSKKAIRECTEQMEKNKSTTGGHDHPSNQTSRKTKNASHSNGQKQEKN